MQLLGIYVRGVLMGAADMVPGVSGGTMAFITGIYDRLLGAIRGVDTTFARQLLAGDVRGAWNHIDGGFVTALALGIGTSIAALARLLSWLLDNHPVPLWAFFFGLILASALVLIRQVEVWSVRRLVLLLAASLAAAGIALAPMMDLSFGLPGVFVAGFIAICAMILPGISGSFILVLLGMYAPTLVAVKTFDLGYLAVFASGAACGLMVFSRLLHWLLHRVHEATMAVLTGFLFGSLLVVWPWKRVLQWVEGSGGDLKPAQHLPVTPDAYLMYTGVEPQLGLCLALMALGFALVWVLEWRWGQRAGAGP